MANVSPDPIKAQRIPATEAIAAMANALVGTNPMEPTFQALSEPALFGRVDCWT